MHSVLIDLHVFISFSNTSDHNDYCLEGIESKDNTLYHVRFVKSPYAYSCVRFNWLQIYGTITVVLKWFLGVRYFLENVHKHFCKLPFMIGKSHSKHGSQILLIDMLSSKLKNAGFTSESCWLYLYKAYFPFHYVRIHIWWYIL